MQFEAKGEYRDIHLERNDEVTFTSLDGASMNDSVLRGVRIGAVSAKHVHMRRVRFEQCDLSNADWTECSLAEVIFTDCRLTGFRLTESLLQSCQFNDCKLDLAQLRFAEAVATRFDACEFREADFYQATLREVQFSRCGFDRAEFYRTRAERVVDFRTSQIAGMRLGIGDLKGAMFSEQQLITLAPLLADLAGFRIAD